jgi:hypothetical protein|tara:strand:+ start:1242 stop:1616 length:375 start_codon:yes stop_codon:yes gene_type:complete
MYSKIIIALCLCSSLQAHEMTPAYPKLKSSYVEGVSVTNLKLFNRRSDVSWYEIGVFTDKWKPVPFASTTNIIEVGYNKKKLFDVYIRSRDIAKAVYICTESKVFKNKEQVTLIASRICSKIKK